MVRTIGTIELSSFADIITGAVVGFIEFGSQMLVAELCSITTVVQKWIIVIRHGTATAIT
jgi:hypothetical protein